MSNPKKWSATFRVTHEGKPYSHYVKGRVAQTILALVNAGEAGITAAEMSCWAYRLGAYVHILRTKYGLDIETLHEGHEGGWHGRYVMHSTVTILSSSQPDKT